MRVKANVVAKTGTVFGKHSFDSAIGKPIGLKGFIHAQNDMHEWRVQGHVISATIDAKGCCATLEIELQDAEPLHGNETQQQ